MGGPNRVHGTMLADNLLQIGAVHIFHDQKVQLAVLVDVVSTDNIGVVQGGNCLGLLVEPVEEPTAFGQGNGQNLNGHSPAQRLVLGQVNDAHAAEPQPFQNLIFANVETAPAAAQPA